MQEEVFFCMVDSKELYLNEKDIKSNIPTRVHHFMADLCTKRAVEGVYSFAGRWQSLNTFLCSFYDTASTYIHMKLIFSNKSISKGRTN